MVSVKILNRETTNQIQGIGIISDAPDKSVCVLTKAFAANKICFLNPGISQAELLRLIVRAELLVVAMTMGVMR